MLRRRPPQLPTPVPGAGATLEAGGDTARRSDGAPPGPGPGRRPARPRLARTGRRRIARRNRLRRLGAALLAAIAGFLGVTALTPRGAAAPGVPTVVAAHDLPPGVVLDADDLVVEPRPPIQRPDTAVSEVDAIIGQVLAAPLSAREVLTASRLRGPALLAGQPAGTVAMSVPVLDPKAAGVAAGSRIDLYASGTGERVARDVTVLATHLPEESTWSSGGAASVLLALDEQSAGAVARSVSTLQAGEIFVVALRSG